MKKILIMNSYDEYHPFGSNKGAEAVLVSTIEILKKYIPDSELVTNIQCSEALATKFNLKVIRNKTFSFKIYSPYTSAKSTIDLFRCILWKTLSQLIKYDFNLLVSNKKLNEFHQADLVVHLGMDLYSSDFGSLSVFEESKNILISTLLGKPIILWAESIGPFKGFFTTKFVKYALRNCSIICVREEISEKHLTSLGIAHTNVKLTADPAFLLTPSPIDHVNKILQSEGVFKKGFLTIGITPSVTFMGSTQKKKSISLMRWAYMSLQYTLPEKIFTKLIDLAIKTSLYSNSELEQQKYISTIAKTINRIIVDLDSTVILIPHVLGKGALIEEKSIALKIWEEVQYKDRVFVMKNDYMADEIKGVIGQCDLFIGGRMHSNIAALSQGIPSIGLAYSHKFMGIMSALGQEGFVCSELDYHDLITKIETLSKNRENIAIQINHHLKDIKQLALLNGELASELIK